MSLLLEALKRAERAKRQQSSDTTGMTVPPVEESKRPNKEIPASPSAPLAVEESTSEPLLALDLSGLEAFEAAQNTLSGSTSGVDMTPVPTPPLEPSVAPLPQPESSPPASTDSPQALEFSLAPFDLPGLADLPPLPPAAPEEDVASALPTLEWAAIPDSAATAQNDEAPAIADALSTRHDGNTLEFSPSPPVTASTPAGSELRQEAAATTPEALTAQAAPQLATALDFALPDDLDFITPPQETTPEPVPLAANPLGVEPTISEPTKEPHSSTHTEVPLVQPSTIAEAAPAPTTVEPPAEKLESKTPPLSGSHLEEAREKARRLLGKPAPAVPDQAAPARRFSRRQKLMLSLLTGSILLGAGGSFYVWQQIAEPTAAPAAPVAPIADSPESTIKPEAPPPAPDIAATNAGQPLAPESAPASGQTSADTPSNIAKPGNEPVTPPTQPTGPISIVRNPPRIDVLDEAVRQGYAAYDRGDYNSARNQYQRAVKSDPRNRQALLGLAATEEASGNKAAAASLYTQALSLDPRDQVAQAALLNMTSADPAQGESRLRVLIAEQPDRAFLHFALGNVLAAQSKWPEAEHAYFRATEIEPGNPDYAFNLAISLDQLHQTRPARDHYQRALDLSARKPARFDREVARQRLEKLSSQP